MFVFLLKKGRKNKGRKRREKTKGKDQKAEKTGSCWKTSGKQPEVWANLKHLLSCILGKPSHLLVPVTPMTSLSHNGPGSSSCHGTCWLNHPQPQHSISPWGWVGARSWLNPKPHSQPDRTLSRDVHLTCGKHEGQMSNAVKATWIERSLPLATSSYYRKLTSNKGLHCKIYIDLAFFPCYIP